MKEYLYRYDQYLTGNYDALTERISCRQVKLHLQKFEIIKTTPKGVWIDDYGSKKFVNLCANKKYACKTIKEAQESFRKRKLAQIRILSRQLQDSKDALTLIKRELNTPSKLFSWNLK